MGAKGPFFLSGGEWSPPHAESLLAAAVSHPSRDLDQEARLAVEGHGHDGHASDPEVVVCARWAEIMEAA